MKKIENAASRQVTFSKRRNGLLKKAYELSVLCDAEVALIVFSQTGKCHEFSSSDMQKTIQRYGKAVKEMGHCMQEQHLEREMANMGKDMESIEVSHRKMLGQYLGMGSCSIEELEKVGDQLVRSLQIIKLRKAQLFREHIEYLKTREQRLLDENAQLRQKAELFIGLPEMRGS